MLFRLDVHLKRFPFNQLNSGNFKRTQLKRKFNSKVSRKSNIYEIPNHEENLLFSPGSSIETGILIFHLTLYHSRALAPMAHAVIKPPVKRVSRAKDIVVCVTQDLRDRIVKVVGHL